jgi:hypothetical protein
MIVSNKLLNFLGSLFLICFGCVPLQQQISDAEDAELEGFVGPLIIDEDKFQDIASLSVYDRKNVDEQLLPSNSNITYESTFDGKVVYIRNCKCLSDIKVIQNKLIVTHSHGGDASNREATKLLWTGRHYQNLKGEFIVDVMVFSDKIDVLSDKVGIRRDLIREKIILDILALQMTDANFVWINLVGYDRLIRYTY